MMHCQSLPVSESIIQVALAEYICRRFPDVIFHSDFGSGAYLTRFQAQVNARQNGFRRGWPDMFIAKPIVLSGKKRYHGLFIELKRKNIMVTKRGGGWANEHLREQGDVLLKLADAGYAVTMALGLDAAIEAVDDYLLYNRRRDARRRMAERIEILRKRQSSTQ